MKKHDMQAFVWLTGSHKRITRTIYTDGNTYYTKWYGQFIEVKPEYSFGCKVWRTVEDY